MKIAYKVVEVFTEGKPKVTVEFTDGTDWTFKRDVNVADILGPDFDAALAERLEQLANTQRIRRSYELQVNSISDELLSVSGSVGDEPSAPSEEVPKKKTRAKKKRK